MGQFFKVLLCGFLMLTQNSFADVYEKYIPHAEIVGQGIYSFMFWDVYKAELVAPKGQWSHKKPFALKLSYLRDLKGEAIADRSKKEMRQIGLNDESKLEKWHQKLREIFPNVQRGDVIVGIHTQKGVVKFYHNENLIGVFEDPSFAKWFFGIWLDEKTSAKSFRNKLLNL